MEYVKKKTLKKILWKEMNHIRVGFKNSLLFFVKNSLYRRKHIWIMFIKIQKKIFKKIWWKKMKHKIIEFKNSL